MTAYSPIVDPQLIDTPDDLAPAAPIATLAQAPVQGTGLSGAAYAPGDRINSIAALDEIVAANQADATFTATTLAYGAKRTDTTIAEFLGADAASIAGDGDLEMGPSGLVMTGYVFIPAGVHTLTIASDDGFELSLGGAPFMSFEGRRATEETSRSALFEGGLYALDLSYFDGGGAMSLRFEIDGLPVDQSALYAEIADFTNPAPGVQTMPVEDYHPSHTIFAALDLSETPATSAGRDVVEGDGGDDSVDGGAGDDEIYGGYGDDSLMGGADDDVLDGGRGSDLIDAGDGDDLIISRSDAGEQRIGQLAIGDPTRPDPDGEVDPVRQKLIGYENQPLTADDILIGGEGDDVFLFSPQINGKLEIIQRHVRADGTINWAGVAGENDELHDHWVDSFGIDLIADFVAGEDSIAVIGHTATVEVTYRDTDGDGDEESIVSVISNQHGGGGAHDRDLIGQIIVHGDRVEAEDIQTDANVTYGIVETYAEIAEALFPEGEVKTTEIAGETVYGYDTRGPGGALGPITGAPEDFIENPYLASVVFADPTTAEAVEPTRAPFAPLGFVDVAGQTATGGGGADLIAPTAPASAAGLPGALGYWRLSDGAEGAYEDARGGADLKAYRNYENQALLREDGGAPGPDGAENGALSFNGEDEFAFIPHDPAFQITQGTLALWVRPADLSGKGIFVSKDARGLGDGGHLRLGHGDDGRLFLRMAEGDRGQNHAWETRNPVLTEGEWAHVAVSFTDQGVAIYLDGARIGDGAWRAVEGDVAKPGQFTEAYPVANDEPWILGADSFTADLNGTAARFATDDDKLRNAFEGDLADFGVWGGFDAGDALTGAELRTLIADGPGAALIAPAGAAPMRAGDDAFDGAGGADTVLGEAGNDTLGGGGGADSVLGGYGDDIVDGDAGNDTVDGGRGSDLVRGGAGDDLLRSLADVGEDRAGQLVLDAPSRPYPDPSIDPDYLKLVDWIDQPLRADDILVGGAGADHFYFGTLINAKRDIILRHVNDDRTIDWRGVAGENRRIHDHWVDGFGIDVVADYDAAEDSISVIGHTTQIEVDYITYDTDGDGIDDDVVSIITAYSQQGGGGGAHDEDYLGFVVVHGDLVREEDVATNAGVHHGIVRTIDELQEALAPSGEVKETTGPNGETLFGYDSRDVEGDPIGTDPEAYAENIFRDMVAFESAVGRAGPIALLTTAAGGVFDGATAVEHAHVAATAQRAGTWALTFTADAPGGRKQALISKDFKDFETGGHMTMWLDHGGRVNLRFQSKTDNVHLRASEVIAAGVEHHVAFSFAPDGVQLFLDGRLADADVGFADGMLGNDETLVIGASTRRRVEDDDRLEWFFEGEIGDVHAFDRPLTEAEAILLAAAGGDPAPLGATTAPQPVDPDPAPPLGGPADESGGGDGGDGDGGDGGGEALGDGPGVTPPAPAPTPSPTPPAPEAPPIATLIPTEADAAPAAGATQRLGGNGTERMVGSARDDWMTGRGGKDNLIGQGGDDYLDGGAHGDVLTGGGGADTLIGGRGKDGLFGGASDDLMFGGGEGDLMRGGAGEDTLLGGAGIDHLYGGAHADLFVMAPGGGRDVIWDFQNGHDRIAIEGPTPGYAALGVHGSGRDVYVNYQGGQIVLKNTTTSELDASDFVF